MSYRPADPFESPRFVGVRTFMRLPHVTGARKAKAFVVGVPFDTGASFRVGARFAPEAIRSISALLRPYHPGHQFDIFDRIAVADAGDLVVTPGFTEASFDQVEQGLSSLLKSSGGGVPIVLGGDHAAALPVLRALKAFHRRPLALIHRGLAGLQLIGFDVVEVYPQYDGPGQVTALLAANLCWEFFGACRRTACLR